MLAHCRRSATAGLRSAYRRIADIPAAMSGPRGALRSRDHFDPDLSRRSPSGEPSPIPGGLPTRPADLGVLGASVGLSGPLLSQPCISVRLSHACAPEFARQSRLDTGGGPTPPTGGNPCHRRCQPVQRLEMPAHAAPLYGAPVAGVHVWPPCRRRESPAIEKPICAAGCRLTGAVY